MTSTFSYVMMIRVWVQDSRPGIQSWALQPNSFWFKSQLCHFGAAGLAQTQERYQRGSQERGYGGKENQVVEGW